MGGVTKPLAAVTLGRQSSQTIFLSPTLPWGVPHQLCQLGLCGTSLPFCPQAHPGAVPSTRSLAEPGSWQPTPLGGMGAQPHTLSPTNTNIWGFFPIDLHFFPPKLRQIFPGCESWTSNPVPNSHHVIQLGQKSKSSHLSESRCKCLSSQAHDAEVVSETADPCPLFSPQNLSPRWVLCFLSCATPSSVVPSPLLPWI